MSALRLNRSRPWCTSRRWLGLWLLLATVTATIVGTPPAGAHTELERAEPPIGGVVVAPPDRIELIFTGAVAATDPAPSLQVFDEAGDPQPVQLLPLGDDPHSVVAEIGALEAGTYTVAWTVQSASDGHILSGTYGFRVGGGVPPGMASTEGEIPAPWAVATRWITFLGIAVALTGFLFDRAVLRRDEQPAQYLHRRARLILAGAAVALLASLAEPLLQTWYPPENVELDLSSAIAGLPTAWWLRPVGMGITVALGVVLAGPFRGRMPRFVPFGGVAASLLALAGLSLTSHAAGRETWQMAATLSNLVHQISVALWTGGLVLLALWWPFRDTTAATSEVAPLRRFSTLALPLVTIALATGAINTGFAFPLAAGVEEYGVTPDAFATLWTSNYGYVLLAKLLILIVPLGLAITHRATIARVVGTASARVGARLGRTIRLELFAVAAVVLAGVGLALSAPPTIERPPLDEVVLTAPAYTADGAMTGVVHLTLDPAEPGENRLQLQVTDLYGEPLATEPLPAVTLDVKSLEHSGVHHAVELPLVDPSLAAYAVGDVPFGPNGWWEITTTIARPGQEETQARMYLLLPDPNVHGFDAPPDRAMSAEAEAVFERGLARMTSWTSVRSRERIASGSDAVAIIERAVTTGGEDEPPAQTIVGVYSAGFAPSVTGEPVAPPKFVFSYSVTVGDQGWRREPDGSWQEAPPTRASLPDEWDNTYVGAEDFQLGVTDEINGEAVQVVTFYLPEQGAQAEAWFAWWVGTESANVYRVAMVAQAHYMLVEYSDINAPIRIEEPVPAAEPER